jgi:uncharacterized membrane protein YbhN (UPF0104 family)
VLGLAREHAVDLDRFAGVGVGKHDEDHRGATEPRARLSDPYVLAGPLSAIARDDPHGLAPVEGTVTDVVHGQSIVAAHGGAASHRGRPGSAAAEGRTGNIRAAQAPNIETMAASQALVPPHRRIHPRRILIGALVLVIFGSAATLFGWDISGWVEHVWNTSKTISLGYLLAAIVLITVQTTTTAFAWYSILRHAYGREKIGWQQVLACYSAAVALNFVLPANLGTLAMLLMFTTIIAAASFAGILAGYVVQKAFYTLIGTASYIYLFLTVGGSFNLQLGFAGSHPWAAVILVAAAGALVVLVARVLRERIRKWWEQAKEGGQILVQPKAYFGLVMLPEFISWLAMLGVIAVFLSAYNIPVSFHTLMRVVAGNSLANMTSVTPGGAGVVQGFNVLSLKGITSSANATAYSVAQQLVTTAWSIFFAIVMMVRAFGWSEGKTLVHDSYGEAREKAAEQSASRKAKRQARKAARQPSSAPGDAET